MKAAHYKEGTKEKLGFAFDAEVATYVPCKGSCTQVWDEYKWNLATLESTVEATKTPLWVQ